MLCSSSLSNKRRSSSSNMAAVWEVEGIDDILMLILVRLPPKSIFRFRCVSKRWNNIISSPFFGQTFYFLRKTLGPKIVASIREEFPEASKTFLRNYSQSIYIIPMSRMSILDTRLKRRRICFVNSSNGLILFYQKFVSTIKFLILNPITMSEVCLSPPTLPEFIGYPALALVCEENMHELVLSYKVVIVGKRKEDSYFTMITFCSKTGEWTTSTITPTPGLNDVPQRITSKPLVVDGIIHWFTSRRMFLVVYYMESSAIQKVELPSECRDIFCLKAARSSRDDDLWLCMLIAESCCIKIWMMPSEEYDSDKLRSSTIPRNSWILMHTFIYPAPVPAPTTPTPTPTPEEGTTNMSRVYRKWWRRGVQRIEPCAHFFIRSYRDLHNFNPYEYFMGANRDRQHFNRYEFSPYIEALTLSSYAL